MVAEALSSLGVLLYFLALLVLGISVAIAIGWRVLRNPHAGENAAKLQRLRGESLVNTTIMFAGAIMLIASTMLAVGEWIQQGGFNAPLGSFIREDRNIIFAITSSCIVLGVANLRRSQIAEQRDALEKARDSHPHMTGAE